MDQTYEEIINKTKDVRTEQEEVIYGVYDNSRRSLLTKINDFFIDRGRISLKERSYFFHLLAVMIDAGIPMVETLKILAKRTDNEHFRRVINTLAYNTEIGNTLSGSMARFPDVFSEAEVGIVKSGEAVGHLDVMLLKLAKQLEESYDLHLKIKSALLYPALVIATLIAAGGIIMTFVVPKLVEFFKETSAELPALTRAVIFASDFLSKYWWAILIVILMIFVIFGTYLKTESGRLRFDYYKLKFPIVGNLLRKTAIYKFAHMLGILITSGLPITKTLEIISQSMENELYKRSLLQIKEKVQNGEKIYTSMQDAPFLFPNVVTKMINMGEQSASLDSISEKLARQYDREITHSVKNLTTVLEPTVIVIVALLVGILAIAIMGPIFSLSETVG